MSYAFRNANGSSTELMKVFWLVVVRVIGELGLYELVNRTERDMPRVLCADIHAGGKMSFMLFKERPCLIQSGHCLESHFHSQLFRKLSGEVVIQPGITAFRILVIRIRAIDGDHHQLVRFVERQYRSFKRIT